MCEYKGAPTALDPVQYSENLSVPKIRSLLRQADACRQCPENIDDGINTAYNCRCRQNKRIHLKNVLYHIMTGH